MKAQISRDSFKEDKDYSAVYQQQGRMLTDADWNEMVRILKQRMDRTVGAAIDSGSPREDGILYGAERAYDDFKNEPRFRWGRVYIDGLYGEVKGDGDNLSILDFIRNQRDFPHDPWDKLENGREYPVYIDLWERLVVAQEEPGLKDKALHGADTCVRTQTMAQVKLAPASTEITNLKSHGTAKLDVNVRPKTTTHDTDICDGELHRATSPANKNALFRLEVHSVHITDGAVDKVTLKWSSENGAEERSNKDTSDELAEGDFLKDGYVYECFSTDTEKHLGEYLLDGVDEWHVGELYSFVDYKSKRKSEPDSPARTMPRIRRWDGYVTLECNPVTGQWSNPNTADKVAKVLGQAPRAQSLELSLKADERKYVVKLSLVSRVKLPAPITPPAPQPSTPTIISHLSPSIRRSAPQPISQHTPAYYQKYFMAGDYWLILLRDDGSDFTAERLSEQPVGVMHHYMDLGTVTTDNTGQATFSLEEPTWRKLSFPSLTSLTLDRVLIENNNGDEIPLTDKFVHREGGDPGGVMTGNLTVPNVTVSSNLIAGKLGVNTENQQRGQVEITSAWGDWLFLEQKRATEGGGGFQIHNPWRNGDDASRNSFAIAYKPSDGTTLWDKGFSINGPSGDVKVGGSLEVKGDATFVAGKVGIGTEGSPHAALTVAGSAYAEHVFRNTVLDVVSDTVDIVTKVTELAEIPDWDCTIYVPGKSVIRITIDVEALRVLYAKDLFGVEFTVAVGEQEEPLYWHGSTDGPWRLENFSIVKEIEVQAGAHQLRILWRAHEDKSHVRLTATMRRIETA